MKLQKPKQLLATISAILFSFSAFSQDGRITSNVTKACQYSSNAMVTFTELSSGSPDSTITFKYRINGSSPYIVTTLIGDYTVKVPVNTNTLGSFTYTLDSVRYDEGPYFAATGGTSGQKAVTISIGTSSSGTGYFSACRNQIPFYWGSTKIDSAGSYSTILKNSYGCDSFVTATFSLISNTDTSISRDTVCFSQFPYSKYGLTFTKPGTYYQSLFNGIASPYKFPADTSVLSSSLGYLYSQMYAFASAGTAGNHDNFGQKAFDISNDLMGNDMLVHSQGYGFFNRDYQYTETQNVANYRRSDVARRRFFDMLYTIKGILDAIDVAPFSTVNREAIKGQSYGLRAYCYYYLVNYFQQTYFGNTTLRGLPIIKEKVVVNNSYGTVQDIYNLMISDLTNAETLLTGKVINDKTVFGISAVYGFRARVALLQNDWANAALYANKSYTSVGATTLMTPTQYKEGFSKISNPEWIWGSYITAPTATIYASFFSHFDIKTNGYASLGGQKKITKYLYDKIPVGDVRKTMFQQAATLSGTSSIYTDAVASYTTPTSTSPVYNQLKFRVPTPGSWAADYVYMRTAEMYLIEAEAKARLGNNAGSRTVLETLIKSRYPAYSAASFSGSTLIDEILLQRRIELWGEGFSLIDLKRTNAGLNRPTGTGNHGSGIDPVVYTLPAGSPLMVWVTPTRDSGLIIPCEKVEKLVLTKKVVKETINKSVCTSQLPYTWNGNDYNSSGVYFYFATTQDNSCDSLAILNLSINNCNIGIAGNCISPKNSSIKNAILKLSGDTYANALSDNNGNYSFTLATGNYILKPTKNNDIKKNNGVTAIDIILTQRHILNATRLNSAFKIIAADVNNDKSVSNIDVIFMKRLILGIDTTFKGNRLWAFVDSAYKFPDTTNPFPYKDSISVSNLTSNKTNQTFIGVKLGDVNYDWNPMLARGVANKPVELVYELRSALKVRPDGKTDTDFQSDLIHIPITVNNFNNLTALQYTLNFNNKDYEYVGIENNKLGIEFNQQQATRNGSISFLWANAKGEAQRLEDGSVLFEIVLKPKQGIRNWELGIGGEPIKNLQLTINNSITEIEAWDKDNLQHNIILTKRETNNEKPVTRNEWFSVSPNPNDGNIVVAIAANATKKIIFELTDAQSKTLYSQRIEVIKGTNNFKLNLNKNSKLLHGIYFIKAIGLDGVEVKKVLVK
jgi:hypothetical protein